MDGIVIRIHDGRVTMVDQDVGGVQWYFANSDAPHPGQVSASLTNTHLASRWRHFHTENKKTVGCNLFELPLLVCDNGI